MWKVIHLELCKKCLFCHKNIWQMQNLESVLEIESYKFLSDFGIQSAMQNSAWWPDLVIVNENIDNLLNIGYCGSGRPYLKLNESEKQRQILSHCYRNKNLKEDEGDCDTNCNWWAWYNDQRIGKWTGSGDHLENNIIKISHNTEKSSGNLRKLAVTQTPGKGYQLTLVWKNLKGVK